MNLQNAAMRNSILQDLKVFSTKNLELTPNPVVLKTHQPNAHYNNWSFQHNYRTSYTEMSNPNNLSVNLLNLYINILFYTFLETSFTQSSFYSKICRLYTTSKS